MKKEVSLRLNTPTIDIYPDGRMNGRQCRSLPGRQGEDFGHVARQRHRAAFY